MKMGKLILCCVAAALEIHSQTPAITGVGNHSISPGSIEYIFGSDFGTAENTTVTVGGLKAKVIAVSNNQIRALLPLNLPTGPATLTVTVDGTVVETANVTVLPHDPEQVALGKGSVSGGPATQFYLPNLSETHTVPPAITRPSLPNSSAAAATTGSGIVYTCDPSITALSATACNTLNTTIAGLYSSAFTNANASIYVTLVNGGAFSNSNWVYNYSSAEYSSFRNALIASASDTNDTTAIEDSVPAVNPYASSSLGLVTSLQRALGLSFSGSTGLEADLSTCILGTAGCYDGIISLGNEGPWYFRTGVISSNQYDFFTFAEHETDEILGTPSACCGSSSGIVFPADYFRYHSNGTRSFAFGTDDPCSSGDSTNACFSIDGINMLQQYNNLNIGQDTGDWVYNCAHPLVQDYATCAGTAGVDISPGAEILVLDVLGYTLRNPSLSGGITNVTSSTPDGTYGVGASIPIQVTFSEPVTVTGTPQLALNSGGTAGYSFGSGTNTLTFIYAVAPGQSSAGLDYASTGSLTLNGGGIKGQGGTPENLTLAVPGTPGALGRGRAIVIDTSPTAIAIGGVEGAGLSVPAVTALSANTYFTIFGANFAPAGTSRQLASSDVVNGSLPTNLGSTCVNVGPARAFPTFVSPSQINAIAPSLPATGSAGVSVVVNCGTPNEATSPVVNVPLAAASPEFLYWVQNANGQDPAVAVDAVHGDYIGPPGLIPGLTFRPAVAGDILTVYGIGFGQTGSGPVPGLIPSVADSVPAGYSVMIGGTTASASYVGVTPGDAGLYQVNVTIPTGIAPGNYSIVLKVNGVSTPAGAFLAIGP